MALYSHTLIVALLPCLVIQEQSGLWRLDTSTHEEANWELDLQPSDQWLNAGISAPQPPPLLTDCVSPVLFLYLLHPVLVGVGGVAFGHLLCEEAE